MNETPTSPKTAQSHADAPTAGKSHLVGIGLGALALALAGWALLSGPRPAALGGRFTALEDRLGGLEGLRQDAGALEARLKALEGKPAPSVDLGGLEGRLAQLTARLEAAERQAIEQVQAAEQRVRALEARPVVDPASVTPRGDFVELGTRVQQTGEQLSQLRGRVAEVAEQGSNRVTQLEQAAAQRVQQTEQALRQSLTALEAATQQKVQAETQAIGQRISTLEQEQKRFSALEQRTAQLAAIDRLRSALAAGQPLGTALQPIKDPPSALTRFATLAPPTEAGLRLSFEQAAQLARAASDAAMNRDGSKSSVLQSAGQRLSGLVTVRRGEQVVWGDAAEAELERARRALVAGDLELSLSALEKLPPAARQAMEGWADQARALIAARAALRQLAAG
jgi:hypothetical protein